MEDREKKAAEVMGLIKSIFDKIRPILGGHPAEIQGAVLADLLATWLAGHPPFLRENLLLMHFDMVRSLTVANENIMFGGGGHPQQEQPDFHYFECPDCGFDCIHPAAFDGDDICPLCDGDNNRGVKMNRRTAVTTDVTEGRDARRGATAAPPDVQ